MNRHSALFALMAFMTLLLPTIPVSAKEFDLDHTKEVLKKFIERELATGVASISIAPRRMWPEKASTRIKNVWKDETTQEQKTASTPRIVVCRIDRSVIHDPPPSKLTNKYKLRCLPLRHCRSPSSLRESGERPPTKTTPSKGLPTPMQ